MKFLPINNNSQSSERPKLALCLENEEWNRMKHLIKEGVLIQEEKEKKSAELIERKNRSRNLTKEWPNTLLNIQKQREREREENKRKKEQEKVTEFNEIVKKHAREREEIIKKAKALVYSRNESCRIISSALLTSAILEEREKQIDLKRRAKSNEIKIKEEEAAINNQKAEEFKKEILNTKMLQVEQKNSYRTMLDEQLKHIQEDRQKQMEEKLREKLDWDETKKELEQIKSHEKMRLEKEKIKLRQEQEEWKIMEARLKGNERQREENENQKLAKYLAAKEETDKKRKQVEDKLRAKIFERQAKIPLNMRPGQQSSSHEDEILMKALAEENERVQKKIREQLEKKENLKKELIQFQKEAAWKADEEIRKEREQRRWDMLQRLALHEADEAWKLAKVEEKKRTQQQLREILLTQWQEKEEKEKKEGWDNVSSMIEEQMKQKEMLLEYCQQIQQEIIQSKRPIHPLLTAIAKVKKLAGIREDNKLVPFLQSRVPIRSVSLYNNTSSNRPSS